MDTTTIQSCIDISSFFLICIFVMILTYILKIKAKYIISRSQAYLPICFILKIYYIYFSI